MQVLREAARREASCNANSKYRSSSKHQPVAPPRISLTSEKKAQTPILFKI